MRKIGRYEITGFLGRGSMSKVYRVNIPVIDKLAALKCLDPGTLMATAIGAGNIREMFISEARIIANLRHPNILDIYSLEEADGNLFYLMDYFCRNLGTVMGETYWPETPSRIMPMDKAVHYTLEILEGLSMLHDAGIVHRDIKPFNIMLTDHGSVKIADFGLSKTRGETASVSDRLPDQVTFGTRFYSAPEVEAAPDDADGRADLFSVGVMFYRMLTGKLPVDPVEPPSALNPDVDAGWDRFILKAVHQDADRRFQTARSMGDALRDRYEDWKKEYEAACKVGDAPVVATPGLDDPSGEEPGKPRSAPIQVKKQKAREHFNLDSLWRPRHYTANAFEPEKDIVIDHATGLAWQRSGSAYPMPLDQARAYIDELNARRFGGMKGWRLPTIPELISVLNPTPHGNDFCMEPVFDRRQTCIWSADTRSFKAAWYADVEMGYVSWHDEKGFFHVKAVCELDIGTHNGGRGPGSEPGAER